MEPLTPTARHRVGGGSRPRDWYVPLALGVGATLLLPVGLSGLGDAQSPQEPAERMATHFTDRRTDVLAAAPFGYAGAAALAALAVYIVRRLLEAGQRGAAIAVAIGAGVIAAYHVGVHVVYTTLSYEVAAESPTPPRHSSS
jgi:hypothetical protein